MPGTHATNDDAALAAALRSAREALERPGAPDELSRSLATCAAAIDASALEERMAAACPRARRYLEELRADRARLLAELDARPGRSRRGRAAGADPERGAALLRAWRHHLDSIARLRERATR